MISSDRGLVWGDRAAQDIIQSIRQTKKPKAEKPIKTDKTNISDNREKVKERMNGIFIIMIGIVIIFSSLLFWFYSGDLFVYSAMSLNIEQMEMWTNIRVIFSPILSMIGIVIIIIGIVRWNKEYKEKER